MKIILRTNARECKRRMKKADNELKKKKGKQIEVMS